MNLLTKDASAVVDSRDAQDKPCIKCDLGPAPERVVQELGTLFKLLADKTRLRILYYLTQRKELHVRALCDLLGESQPAVSHHLALLRSAGLIERRREGKHNYYALRPKSVSALLDRVLAEFPSRDERLLLGDYLLQRVTGCCSA